MLRHCTRRDTYVASLYQAGYMCCIIVSGGIHMLRHCIRRDTYVASLYQVGYICCVIVSGGIHMLSHCVRRDTSVLLLCQAGYICSIDLSVGCICVVNRRIRLGNRSRTYFSVLTLSHSTGYLL